MSEVALKVERIGEAVSTVVGWRRRNSKALVCKSMPSLTKTPQTKRGFLFVMPVATLEALKLL